MANPFRFRRKRKNRDRFLEPLTRKALRHGTEHSNNVLFLVPHPCLLVLIGSKQSEILPNTPRLARDSCAQPAVTASNPRLLCMIQAAG